MAYNLPHHTGEHDDEHAILKSRVKCGYQLLASWARRTCQQLA